MIPIYGRWLCSPLFPTLLQDKSAAEPMERMDHDFLELEKHAFGLMRVGFT